MTENIGQYSYFHLSPSFKQLTSIASTNAEATSKDLNNSLIKVTMSKGLVNTYFCLRLVNELEVITTDAL